MKLFLTKPAFSPADAQASDTTADALTGASGRKLYDHDTYGRASLVKRTNCDYTPPAVDGVKQPQMKGITMARFLARATEAKGADIYGNDNPMDLLVKIAQVMNADAKAIADAPDGQKPVALIWHGYEMWIDKDAMNACLAQAKEDADAKKPLRQTPPEGYILELNKQARGPKPRLTCQPATALRQTSSAQTGSLL